MSSLTPKHREFQKPINLARLLAPLPPKLLQQVAADFAFDKWAYKLTFAPYFKMHLLLSLKRYQVLSERCGSPSTGPSSSTATGSPTFKCAAKSPSLPDCLLMLHGIR
jgi:hypothetical protein